MKERFKNAVSVLLFIAFSLHANARIFFVTETNDTTEVASLRGAIIAANRMGGRNTIILGSTDFRHRGVSDPSRQWVYYLTIPGANEGASLTGDLNINRGELTIIGMSPDVTIDATGLGDRVFQVSSNAQLTLENLTIKGGTATFDGGLSSGRFGGGIYNSGTLILEQCVITNNASGGGYGNGTNGGDGGGIYNNGNLQADNCTIVGNTCAAGVASAFGGNGGGIRNDGYSELTRCIVKDNQAGAGGGPEILSSGAGGGGGNGGAIFNSGTLILGECIIGGNTAGPGANGGPGESFGSFQDGWGGSGGCGGGIYNMGELEIDFSTVCGNGAGNGGDGVNSPPGGIPGTGGDGGGIFNAGELSVNTSTISGNLCGTGGVGGGGSGGVEPGGAGGSGGGIYNSAADPDAGINPGSLELTSSTITLNECGAGGNGGNVLTGFTDTNAATGSGGNAGDGGGVANDAGTNAVMVRNTLIAQNLPNTGGAPGTNVFLIIYFSPGGSINEVVSGTPGADSVGFDVAGAFTSEGFNLIGISDGSIGFINGVNADQAGTEASPIDPLLGPLQMNGGFTPTHALLWGSPAIDQGNCFGIHRDQRGLYRPYVFSSIPEPQGGDGSDIGAFELESR